MIAFIVISITGPYNRRMQYLKSKRRTLFLVFIVVLIVLGALGAFYFQENAASLKMEPAVVVLAPVQQQNVPVVVDAIGTLLSVNATMLKAEQAGAITAILFHNGQSVARGQLLVQINNASQEAAYQHASAALFQAQSMYRRYQELVHTDPAVLSKIEIDQVNVAFQQARANVAAAAETLRETQVRAPFAGTVGSSTLSVGSYLNVGDSVVALVNGKDLEVVYQVPENDYAHTALGQTVNLTTDAYPGKTFSATVNYVAPLVDPNSRSFTVRAKVLNGKGLSPGMLMRVHHVLLPQHEVLAVPTVSLVSDMSGFGVYEVKNGVVIEKYVTVGAQNGDWTEITSGLSAGEAVIVKGQQKVSPGSRVTVVAATS